ncbi:MAG TPA: SDR family NAD(P)-dependent oxidoreductase [Acidimicrobiales bacterium]
MGVNDRVVVVTGASKGIGRAAALQFAQEGAHLVLNARGADDLDRVADEARGHGGRVVTAVADLADDAGAARVAEVALAEFDRIDVLVNNVGGGGDPKRILKLSASDWQDGFERNFFSSVRATAACLPSMLDQGWGRIVHVASTYGIEPGPFFGPYSAAKAALLNYSKNVARAYSAQGVLSNCVVPGVTITPRVAETAAAAAEAQDATPDEVMAKMMERDPVAIGRFGEPDEVAAAIVFLASGAASWITGAALAVDGGTLRSI